MLPLIAYYLHHKLLLALFAISKSNLALPRNYATASIKINRYSYYTVCHTH